MKIPVFFLMLIFATCPGPKKTATGDTSDQARKDKVGRTRDAVAQNQDSIAQSQRTPIRVQAFHKKMQDSVPGLTFVAGDAYSGVETVETLIITSAKTLKKFYSRVNRTRKPGLPVPDIDFSKEMVVVYCSGAIASDSLPELYVFEETEDEILVGIKDDNRKPSSSAVTTPFVVYRMPITDKEVLVRGGE